MLLRSLRKFHIYTRSALSSSSTEERQVAYPSHSYSFYDYSKTPRGLLLKTEVEVTPHNLSNHTFITPLSRLYCRGLAGQAALLQPRFAVKPLSECTMTGYEPKPWSFSSIDSLWVDVGVITLVLCATDMVFAMTGRISGHNSEVRCWRFCGLSSLRDIKPFFVLFLAMKVSFAALTITLIKVYIQDLNFANKESSFFANSALIDTQSKATPTPFGNLCLWLKLSVVAALMSAMSSLCFERLGNALGEIFLDLSLGAISRFGYAFNVLFFSLFWSDQPSH